MSEFLTKYEKIPLEFSRDHGLTSVGVVIGNGPYALEVAITRCRGHPAATQMRDAWQDRLRGRPNPLLLVTLYDDKAAICGPTGDNPPVYWDLDIQSIDRICHAALDEPNRHAAHRFIQTVMSGLDEELLGIRNEGLLATHYLRVRMPERADWREGVEKASPLLERRDRELLAGLGYELEPLDRSHVLVTKGTRVAVAVFLHAGEAFDQQQERFVRKSPVAYALVQAEKHNLRYVVASAGGRLRLYLTDPREAVAPRGASETFVEIHLDVLRSRDAGYLWLLFSGDALARGGTLEEALSGSQDYSAQLGRRLRERIYENVLPDMATVIAQEMGFDIPSKENLDLAYGTALALLFRLLFVAYAEDRDLLPYRRNQRYEAHSLKRKAKEILSITKEGGVFDSASTSHWSDVFVLFHAISHGNQEWDVPEYDGDLFSSDLEVSPEGALLEEIELTNDVFGLALSRLLLDWSEDGVQGPVDFRSLGVREFGVIYEGLLESELSIAGQPLKVNANGLYAPLDEGEEALIQVGEFYMHNASGQRKSSGTFFTRDFIVEHLLKHSLDPALEAHLRRLDEMSDRDAEAAFFHFRVADIAMGSAHFLVAAVDHIERRLSAYLIERALPGVEEELDRLQESARRATEGEELRTVVDDRALLRRQIARRCIYGVDLNPMAVQLARVSLWTHTFVPGLPLSFLDHNLVCGDAIVGVATPEEGAEALGLKGDTLLSYMAADKVEAIRVALETLGKLADTDAREIREAREAQRRLEDASAPLRALFDIVTASRVDESIRPPDILAKTESLEAVVGSKAHQRASEVLRSMRPFYFPAAFPEVFRGDYSGFNVVVGNPPWDKVRHEQQQFWVTREAGLNALEATQREERIKQLRKERPLQAEEEKDERQRREWLQAYVAEAYEHQGRGHHDFAKLFVERATNLLAGDGHLGYVLPRQSLVLNGWTDLRTRLLSGSRVTALQVRNRGGWLFESVDHRLMMVLLTWGPTGDNDIEGISVWPGVDSRVAIQELDDTRPLWMSRDEVLDLSDTAAIPWFNGLNDIPVFETMRGFDSLGTGEGWVDGRPDARWDFSGSGKHKKLAATKPTDGGWKVLMARHIMPYGIDQSKSYNRYIPKPEALIPLGLGVSTKGGQTVIAPEHPVLVYRYPSRGDDSRTLIVSALEEQGRLYSVGYVHGIRHERSPSWDQLLALLAFLNTFTCDWWVRRFTDRHVTRSILVNIPLPRWDNKARREAASIAEELLVRGSFRRLPGGRVLEGQREFQESTHQELQARLEALTLKGFDLAGEDLEIILDDFTESGCPADLRDLLREAVA